MRKSLAAILALSLCACGRLAPNPLIAESANPIWPDYMDVTVPVNIAPLNFDYPRGSSDTRTEFTTGNLSKTFRGGKVRWRLSEWRNFTGAAAGGRISVRSFNPDTSWVINVCNDSIDWGLQYRRIAPGYQVAGQMSIRERDLSTFRERILIQTVSELAGCVNCHEYNRCDPGYMQLHLRGETGATFIRSGSGEIAGYDTKTDSTVSGCSFPYWHPSGKFIAYSSDITRQHFYTGRVRLIEALDIDSDLQVLDIAAGEIITCPAIRDKNYLEAFPSFSPDGGTLYFARAYKTDENVERHYKIYSIGFDAASRSFTDSLRVVFDPGDSLSASLARPSYDGRFLMFTVASTGFMHVFNPESDLWVIDTATGIARTLDEVNSPRSEGFHNFDSDSRWFVFTSRRFDGLVTHAYIARMNDDGTATKPFILPQKDPVSYYSTDLMSFNVPCFVTSPVDFSAADAIEKSKKSNIRRMGYRCIR